LRVREKDKNTERRKTRLTKHNTTNPNNQKNSDL